MRKLLLCCALCCLLAGLPASGMAANAKIDPESYICAELVALASTVQEAPLFEVLQMDGYAAAAAGQDVAVPEAVAPILGQVLGICQAQPTEKVAAVWQAVRQQSLLPENGPWHADRTTCGQFTAAQEDGSGFPVWLDGYNRQKNGNRSSILNDNESFQGFLKACAKKPDSLMLDVLREQAR
ncbi:MAG: hypothetical protein IJD16_03100 [Desulfovibrio sp.]|nr:hypothetical protein [Desulfovibrio sp.]